MAARKSADLCLKLVRRQAPAIEVLLAAARDQPVRDVVAQTGALLRFRMRWRQPVSGFIKDFPAK